MRDRCCGPVRQLRGDQIGRRVGPARACNVTTETVSTPTTTTIQASATTTTTRNATTRNAPLNWPITWKSPDANDRKTGKTVTKKRVKKNPKKIKGLTDSQRAAEAHTHFIIHHGVVEDATRFLSHKANSENVSAATVNRLKALLPTWEHAKAMVFSSSDESAYEYDDTLTEQTSTTIPVTDSPYQSTTWIPTALAPAWEVTNASDSNAVNYSATPTKQPSANTGNHSATPTKQPRANAPTVHTPTIHGHHHPTHTYTNNTHTPPRQLTLSPIQHINEHNSPKHPTPTLNTYISILNDTYLIIHDN